MRTDLVTAAGDATTVCSADADCSFLQVGDVDVDALMLEVEEDGEGEWTAFEEALLADNDDDELEVEDEAAATAQNQQMGPGSSEASLFPNATNASSADEALPNGTTCSNVQGLVGHLASVAGLNMAMLETSCGLIDECVSCGAAVGCGWCTTYNLCVPDEIGWCNASSFVGSIGSATCAGRRLEEENQQEEGTVRTQIEGQGRQLWGGRHRHRPHWHHPHRPHRHWPHVHYPHRYSPHVHAPPCVSGPLQAAYSRAAGWIRNAVSAGINTGISTSSMCCNLPTRRINSRCWYRVRICVALDGRSKLKASTSGLRVAMGFTLTTTITASCDRTFRVEEALKYKIYDHSIYAVTAIGGYRATVYAGLYGSITLTQPGYMRGQTYGSKFYGYISNPTISSTVGAGVWVNGEAYLGLQGKALYIASVSAQAVAKTSGWIKVCPNGVQSGAKMNGILRGSYSVSVPNIQLAGALCSQVAAAKDPTRHLALSFTRISAAD